MLDLLKLKNDFNSRGILISFNGIFTHSIIEEIGNAVKRYLEGEELDRGAVTDVFAVYIEQTQNVRNYITRSSLIDDAHSTAIVVISRIDDYYVVSSGNSIHKKDVKDLTERIEKINSLDKSGLKQLYREQLHKPADPSTGGAGVGLIEMGRRAVGRLEYSFLPLDNEYDFFSLKIKVRGV